MKMHFHKVNKGLLSLLFIVGLFKITGVDSVENQQKGKQDVASTEFEYEDSNEPEVPTNGDAAAAAGKADVSTKQFFDSDVNVVYATEEGENVTLNCTPKKYSESRHSIVWFRDNSAINNGNTTLEIGFDIDNKYRLTIYNYTSQTPGNFSCHVMPDNVVQYMRIEFKAPDNISEKNAASITNYWQVLGLMALSLLATASTLY